MKKVLLTGASGFIGKQVLPLLIANNYEVHAVASSTVPADKSVQWHKADLLNCHEIQDIIKTVSPSHLLHLAWYAKPGEYWTSSLNSSWVAASLHLLSSFIKNGGRRVVMAGTCAEYDWNYGSCSELTTARKPTSPYGVCKNALQEMLHSCTEGKISSAWGRIFFLYGPHENPNRLVSSMIKTLLQGEPAHCSDGNQMRDYLYVKDVAGAFVALLNSEVRGPVNIASGTPVSIKEIVNQIALKLDRSNLVKFGTRPLSRNEPPLLTADIGRLANEVRWKPKYDLESGLSETIDWWRTASSSKR
ncbi:MAG: NAD(P)-dependent oxidoreductase [Deltaproteobacteria bacterium]|nr:NAD(P)-dependent oxidoreductase [Deltaproteobacteria bacterium]